MDAEMELEDAVAAPPAAEGGDASLPVAVTVAVAVPAAVAEEHECESDGGDDEDGGDGAAPYAIGAIQEEEEPTDDHEAAPDCQHGDGTANGAGSDGTADGNGQAAPLGMAAAAVPSNLRPLVTRSGDVSDCVECATADGDTFYYHLATGETSWAPPFELLPPLASDRHSSHGESVGSATSSFHHGDADAPTEPGGGREDAAATASAASASASLVKRALDGALRRLDPHTQLQLEEARRRHHELEELRDEEVRMGGELWVEMYDPTHDGFYYYGAQSGEMRWDRPDSYVMRVESDDVLRMVVRLQCVFRMKLARRKVFFMKLQRGLLPASGAGATGDADPLNPWVEVYDPFHKVLYYYCASTGETRWDPPAHFISAAEDHEMAAAIAIQSMSRSHLARREVKKRKTTIRKKQHEQAIEEARRLREVRRKEFSAKTDGEREAMCRREMLEEEMEQIREGDLFWGVDRHDQEVVRQRMEEKLLADAEAFWQRVNMTLRLRVEMEMQRSQEEEAQRRELELVAQAHESDRMRAAEADQCRLGDAFWGIQAEEQREAQARADMDAEQARSRLFGDHVAVEDQHRAWAEERERRAEEGKVAKVVDEKRRQRQYFQWFYSKCETADDVLDYLWPTHQRFTPGIAEDENPEDPARDNQRSPATEDAATAPQTDATPRMPKPPPYALDDAVLRARLETDYRFGNKSIFTVHDPNSARVLGRRGQYVVSHVDTDAVYAAAAKKADAKPRSTSPTRPMPASSKPIPSDTEERLRYGVFPALHYPHARAPDPHLPARYNGVPYHPSDLNPTRDILLSNHTKLTQLPSLAWSPHREPSPKKPLVVVKQPKKSPFPSPHAKATKEPKRRQSSLLLAMQASNNNTVDPLSSSLGFASPFYREAQAARQQALQQAAGQQKKETPDERKAREAQEKAQRMRRKYAARFEAEELGAVHAVFVAMDLDGSGTINKSEMVWALQRDGEVHALARRSALLLLLLKQQSHLEELFVHLRMSDTQREEISWDVFRVFCEELYISLMQQGILDSYDAQVVNGGSPTKEVANATQKVAPSRQQGATSSPTRGRQTRKGSIYVENKEEQLIRRVFGMCDQDGNGVLEIDELQRALYADSDPALQRLIRSSKALQPLLHQNTFVDAFRKFEPLDPRGISEEEFVVFCLEIADIAMLNGML